MPQIRAESLGSMDGGLEVGLTDELAIWIVVAPHMGGGAWAF